MKQPTLTISLSSQKIPQTNQPKYRTFSGHGASTDIVVASAKAYMQALNKLMAAREETESVLAVSL